MAKNTYKQLYLFFIRKVIHHFEESPDFEKDCINSLKEILLKIGQISEGEYIIEGQGQLYIPLMIVKVEILMDSMCNVSDFYRELQVSLLFIKKDSTIFILSKSQHANYEFR